MFCNKNFNKSFPKTLQITLTLQRNEQYRQTTQKPKNGQKVENTENRLEMSFITKLHKAYGYKKFVHQVRVKMLPIIQKSLTNDQNGQTAQKLKSD